MNYAWPSVINDRMKKDEVPNFGRPVFLPHPFSLKRVLCSTWVSPLLHCIFWYIYTKDERVDKSIGQCLLHILQYFIFIPLFGGKSYGKILTPTEWREREKKTSLKGSIQLCVRDRAQRVERHFLIKFLVAHIYSRWIEKERSWSGGL